jgi:Tetratricopeptide repeat
VKTNGSDDLQACKVKALLAIAQTLMNQGKYGEAEQVHKHTLKQAEAIAGKMSPLVGLVLIDLALLYETEGRQAEAKALWERVHSIIRLSYPQFLISHLRAYG